MPPALTSVTAQQTGLELGKRSRWRWESFPSGRPVSGAITWQDVALNDASRKSWPCLPLHDSPLMTDRDAMSERGSIPSWYEDRCELQKYGVADGIGFPNNSGESGAEGITGLMVSFHRRRCERSVRRGFRRGPHPVIPGPDRRCATLWWLRGSPPAPRSWAIGSAGERLVHTEEVTGSIPVSPTR